MRRTSLISGTLIDPDKSCLFANINSVAPANLYAIPPPAVPAMLISETTATVSNPKDCHLLTSSLNKPFSSSLQSGILSRSDESTTQTTASVDSK
jgi:hypothetical protein